MALDNLSGIVNTPGIPLGELEKVILVDNPKSTNVSFIFPPQKGFSTPVKIDKEDYIEFYDSTQIGNLSFTWDNTKGTVLAAGAVIPSPKYSTSELWICEGVRLAWVPEIATTSNNLYTIKDNQIKKWSRPTFAPYEGAPTLSTAYGWWVEDRINYQMLPYCQVSGANGIYASLGETLTVIRQRDVDNYEYPAEQSSFYIWGSTKNFYIAYNPSPVASTWANKWQSIYGVLNGTKYPRWFQGSGEGKGITFPTVESLLVDQRPVLPTPTYSIDASSTTITAGTTVTITLTTTNVPDNTAVPFYITGLISSEINGEPLAGSFIVVNNTATHVITTNSGITSSKKLIVSLTVGDFPA
jgi:hypothetical protein